MVRIKGNRVACRGNVMFEDLDARTRQTPQDSQSCIKE